MSLLTPETERQATEQIVGAEDAIELVGLLAEYETVDAVVKAAARVRKAGFTRWDVHSPFPIHGIDHVMGIRPTVLPWLVLVGGLSGLVGGLVLQWFCNAYDYPVIVSGKPFWSLPANIPVIFECTVLLSALTAVFGLLPAALSTRSGAQTQRPLAIVVVGGMIIT